MKKFIFTVISFCLCIGALFWYLDHNDKIDVSKAYLKDKFYKTTNYFFYLEPYLNLGYKEKKAVIEPYFDKEWYENQYSDLLKESNLSPIDHYLQRGSRSYWKFHCDPTPWFNVTIYKDRLWPTSSDPFVDFLTQPKMEVPKNGETIIVFSNEKQLQRAWLAVEGLMRLSQFNIKLILPSEFKDCVPVQFIPQIKRGLLVDFEPDHLNFYDSEFIKNPDRYDLAKTELKDSYIWHQMITRVKIGEKSECHWHQLYVYTRWAKNGIINPIYMNIGNYTDEPIFYSKVALTKEDFEAYFKRIAPVFDLLLLGPKLDLPNVRIIPGNMETWVDKMPEKKEFSLSFLLSRFKTKHKNFLYNLRMDVFTELENVKNIPTRMYISRRCKGYPSELKKYLLPTDSKIWVFESQFSIALENTIQENYFTEKLLGCFETLTVPIYMGCPNITDYFDSRGMIIVNSLEEIKEAILKLTPELYEEMLPYLKINKERTNDFLKMKLKVINQYFDELSNL
jgi:hypothetical protein